MGSSNIINYKNMQTSKKHFTKEEIQNRTEASKKLETKPLPKTPPKNLYPGVKKYWKKIMKDTEGFEIFQKSDESIFISYCECLLHKEIISDQLIKGEANYIETSKVGQKFLSEQAKLMIQLNNLLLKYSEKLGLTPSARAKLAVEISKSDKKEAKKDSKFDI